ncbi:MAG: hypothetical protein AB7V22_07260 [Kiritimatiellia bacterium]
MTAGRAPCPGADGLRHGALPASGLPARILAVLRAGGGATLGDLRPPLPAGGKLDADDQALLARIAAYACATVDGHPPPLDFSEWLALFLPPRLADAVRLRYGLDDPAAALARHETKLGDVGFKLGVTRERARQLLGLAFGSLRQALPLFAAEPFYRAAAAELLAAGGALSAAEWAGHAVPTWGSAAPVGVGLFLAQLVPGRLVLYRGFFSAFAPSAVDRAEKALRDRLAAANELVPVAALAAGLPKSARPPGVPSAEALLRTLLRHLPDALATRDGRAGLADRHAILLLREILAETGELPLRRLGAAFNERVYPESRRGSGTLRAALRRDPLVRKTAPDRYALPAGLQTGLPL